ncbi:phosphocholine cytidylyltransferase family protein [bacterium]|nr:phosphocholine cytidylyltransferase family protein [bacterium]
MRTVILAAGLGSRLGHHLPKGLLSPGGESLLQRSIRLLEEAGLGPVTLVVGHQAEVYKALPERLQFVDNPHYASTGSLLSLRLAFEELQDDLLVLESDLLYEARALKAIQDSPEPNLILLSGFTQAGDEVYVDAPEGRLRSMSKRREDLLGEPYGEFVGICRFSKELLRDMNAWGASHPEAHYESDGVVSQCQRHRVAVVKVPDLVWCEVDDAHHWQRCQELILPRLRD